MIPDVVFVVAMWAVLTLGFGVALYLLARFGQPDASDTVPRGERR